MQSYAPWLAAGALGLIALFGLLAWRRRRARAEAYDAPYEVHHEQHDMVAAPATAWAAAPEPVHADSHQEEPVASGPATFWPAANDTPEPVHAELGHPEPVHAEPEVHTPVAETPVAAAAGLGAAAAAAPAADAGRPWIDFLMRPVRAGVGEDKAVVEFELSVDNNGSAPAEDVRISTWMFPAGGTPESEVERMLIEPGEAIVPPETIGVGDGRRIEASVALPRTVLHDSILPVVVADARYTLPDGREGRTSATFAVGVPLGEELAHFDVDNPSGLHEHVEARLRGEPQKV